MKNINQYPAIHNHSHKLYENCFDRRIIRIKAVYNLTNFKQVCISLKIQAEDMLSRHFNRRNKD